MTNTELQFTRKVHASTRTRYVLEATEPASDGSFWLHSTERAVAFHVRVNAENLQLGLDQITNNPEAWNQMTWFSKLPDGSEVLSVAPECGTAGCLAGTVALQHGARPTGHAYLSTLYSVHTPAGATVGAAVFATDMLLEILAERIIDEDEIDVDDPEELRWERDGLLDALWAADNKLADLWKIGQFLADGRLEVPSDDVIDEAQRRSDRVFPINRSF